MVNIRDLFVETEYKIELNVLHEWVVSSVIGLISRTCLRGVAEAIVVDLKIKTEDLIPKFILDLMPKSKLDLIPKFIRDSIPKPFRD